MDYYSLLGIGRTASEDDIKAAYRRTARITRPDSIDDPVSSVYTSVQEAYEVLTSPLARRAYDATLYMQDRPSPPLAGPKKEKMIGSESKFSSRRPTANEDGGAFIPSMVPRVITAPHLTSWIGKDYKRSHTIPRVFPHWLTYLSVALLVIGYCIGINLLANEIFANSLSSLRALVMIALWIGIGAACIVVLHKYSRALTSSLPTLVLGSIIAVGSATVAMFDPAISLVLTVITSGAILLASCLRSKAARRGNVKGVLFPADVMEQMVEYGSPGEGLLRAARDGKMPQKGAEQTAYGQKITADILTHLLAIPGVRIIHGLKVPAIVGTDVDHAVLCGDRLALIESSLIEPARYELDQWGDIIVDGGTKPTRHSNFAEAVKKSEIEMKNLHIQGWVVVHPAKEGDMSVVPSQTSNGVRLVDAQTLLEEVGAFLAAGSKNNILDARSMAKLWVFKMNE